MRSMLALALLAALAALSASCAEPVAPTVTTSGERYVLEADTPAPSSRAGGSIRAFVLRAVHRDADALAFVVKSKIYPEDPDTLYLTLRGGGVSVYDVADPGRPALLERAAATLDVEGQDRLGDLLVVVARSGRLLTFDVAGRAIRKLGDLELDTSPGVGGSLQSPFLNQLGTGPFDALHAKLYRPTGDRTFCMVTAPLSEELIAVDVSDPTAPAQVGAVDTGIEFVEGIYLKGDHAFVGGFGGSEAYTAVDISDPANMKVVRTLSDPAYRQMVSEMTPSRPDTLFAALWDDPGGVGAFDVTHPAEFDVIGTLTRHELRRANRVKLSLDHAFLPLEQDPGGFGVVDIRHPEAMTLVGVVLGIPGVTTPYTLEVNGDWLYVFGTEESSMAVFEIERAE